jgi:hypothetical protein
MAALTALAWKASEQSGEARAGCTEEDEVGDDGVEPPSDERAEVRRPLPHGGGAEAVQEEERVTWRRRGRPHVDGGGGGGVESPGRRRERDGERLEARPREAVAEAAVPCCREAEDALHAAAGQRRHWWRPPAIAGGRLGGACRAGGRRGGVANFGDSWWSSAASWWWCSTSGESVVLKGAVAVSESEGVEETFAYR